MSHQDRETRPRSDSALLLGLLLPRAEEEPQPPRTLDSVLKRVKASLPELDDSVKKPQALLEQLLALDEENLSRTLARRPSLHSPVFLDYVRQTAWSALPHEPGFAECLAHIAIEQAAATRDSEEGRRHVLVAYCILSAVLRLRGLPDKADLLLSRSAFLLDCSEDEIVYLRTLAVLRWQQARLSEAHALLARALLLKRPVEQTAPIQLILALLHVLEHVPVPRPLPMLRHAKDSFDSAHQPIQALLARLGLAYALAQKGDLEAAELERVAAQPLFPLVREPKAGAFAGWLDARVSLLTDAHLGLERLQAARKQLVELELPFTATLATVDAVYYLSTVDQRNLIEPFLADAPLPLDIDPAARICRELADPPDAPVWYSARVRSEVLALPSTLRRVCLLRGIPTEPLPFV